MGLDAMMYLIVPKDVTDVQISEASVDIKELFFYGYDYVKPNCLEAVKNPLFKLSDGERLSKSIVLIGIMGRVMSAGIIQIPNLCPNFLKRGSPDRANFTDQILMV